MIGRDRSNASGPAAVSILGDSRAPVTTSSVDTQVFGVSLVPVAAAVKDPQTIYTAVGVETFTGREWLAVEVDRFLAHNPCGYVFIEADAGLGKTAFAAWLVRTRGYLSHFSRYSDGGSVKVGLANLSAQLIIHFGLDNQAPGGMLPDWTQTPGGFESLLATVARQAQRDGQGPVVLVVDGLDEADAPGEGLPLGLPPLLPDGVYVIGTYRTGRSPRRPYAPSATLQIAKEDPRNEDDVRKYLAKVVNEDVLAARLADADMDSMEFCYLLAERCGGVWVYLRYVINEVRYGLRPPNEISNLPSGLREYYSDQIRRWRQDSAWHTGLLALLATLGVAGEALTKSTLARLAGNIDPLMVGRWCDLDIRPLLTTSRASIAGTSLRYEIYHASFRELLNSSDHDEQCDRYPYELLVLTDELKEATASAHDRICDTYLALFGGLNAGLPMLAEDPGGADIDGGYPLRHLAHHLCIGKRASDLHTLLAIEHSTGPGRAINTWFAAHDHSNSIASYMDDLARARSDASATTNQYISHHRSAISLGPEIRYALMASSCASLSANISVDFLAHLIQTGVWSLQRGLDHARRITDLGDRIKALLTVYRHAKVEDQSILLSEALDTVTVIASDSARAKALAGLAPHLSSDLLAQALAAATAISDHTARAEALTALIPRVPADQQPAVIADALAAATAISADTARAEALTALIIRVPADQRSAVTAQALAAATAITDYFSRGLTVARLIPRVQSDLAGQALAAVIAMTDYPVIESKLATLEGLLPADPEPAVMAQALAVATAITHQYSRGRALARLAPHLSSDLVAQALAAATAISDHTARAEALTALIPRVPADQQPAVIADALAAATAISDDTARAETLTALALRVPADQPAVMAQALIAATAISDDTTRAEALAKVALHLPADQRSAVAGHALAIATAVSADTTRAEALAKVAPHLPSDLVAQALAAATAITGGYPCGRALVALAPHLPSDLVAQALAAATAITDGYPCGGALVALAPHLPADLMAQALAAATAITDDGPRSEALAALALHLPADQQPVVMAQALAAATAIADDANRARRLAQLEPHLAPNLPAVVVADALAAASAITNGTARAETLTALALHLPADRQPAVMAQALAAATAIADDWSRSEALTALALHLPADQQPAVMAQALAAVTAITDDTNRARKLAKLASHLSADIAVQALAAISANADDATRAKALAKIAPHLPADQQPAALAQALAAVTAVPDLFRGRALATVAPHLPADLMAQARAAASSITANSDRAIALTALIPHLPADEQPTVVVEALEAATAKPTHDSGVALAQLAPYLPADLITQALAGAVAFTDSTEQARALRGLAPYLPADLVPQAFAALTRSYDPEMMAKLMPNDMSPDYMVWLGANSIAADDIARAWALDALTARLPSNLLPEAVAAAAAIPGERIRGDALIRLGSHLPAELVTQALASVNTITSDSIRAQTLAGLAPYLPPSEQTAVTAEAIVIATAVNDDTVRAQALTGTIPYLPTDQQASVTAQALAAATAIPHDRPRAEALIALAPYLSAHHLAQALAATPRNNSKALVAILRRSRSVLGSKQDVAYLDLLRQAITGTDRKSCFEVVGAVASVIAEIGGADAIEKCVDAIVDVYRWWP
jgi:hypothetical protein